MKGKKIQILQKLLQKMKGENTLQIIFEVSSYLFFLEWTLLIMECVNFFYVSEFIFVTVQTFLYYHLRSVGSAWRFRFHLWYCSFVSFFCPWSSLARSLSILLIFTKNHLLHLLISLFFFPSIAFCFKFYLFVVS